MQNAAHPLWATSASSLICCSPHITFVFNWARDIILKACLYPLLQRGSISTSCKTCTKMLFKRNLCDDMQEILALYSSPYNMVKSDFSSPPSLPPRGSPLKTHYCSSSCRRYLDTFLLSIARSSWVASQRRHVFNQVAASCLNWASPWMVVVSSVVLYAIKPPGVFLLFLWIPLLDYREAY